MTNQQILEKAIQKAIDGGWEPESDEYYFEGNAIYWKGETTTARESIRSLIYDHDFAKALWGEEGIPHWGMEETAWMHHLQQMVIAEDPIKYLGENI